MKYSLCFVIAIVMASTTSIAQNKPFQKEAFPEGTVYHQNIPYANDTLRKHLLDIYLSPQVKPNAPLVIWVHGGAWNHNDKYADMGYMTSTIRAIVEKGYAFASIDYRQSSTAIFPAQIQDCNQAVEFLYRNAARYGLDKNRFALMGFSAGGHLASLLALSANQNVTSFFAQGGKPSARIKAVVDFYGPSDLMLFFANMDPSETGTPIDQLLGASPLVRPDLSKLASPVTYVDKNDPPFFIVHGELDKDVPRTQSYLLKSYLDLAEVKNQFTIVKDAPHYGRMFDTDEVRTKLLTFLDTYLR